MDDLDNTVPSEDDDEELDPRIQQELEKLNAATDGINHLETEFGEAQALFQQMMQDATFQLKSLNQHIGKAVEKSRPYYDALKRAKQGHSTLHSAAIKFEQAQSRHYNAKKVEKKAFSSNDRKLDPGLQEMLNQVTMEVMEASTSSQLAWETHRGASIEFEEKQKAVQVLYKTLQKHIIKSRPYFDLKFTLNRQLEVQKQRLEKIQEGIQLSKNAYADTLQNLEMISDDIHRAREEKRRTLLLGPRGQCVGAADSDGEQVNSHIETMKNIRKMTLDDIHCDVQDASDSESTDSEEMSNDDYLQSDTHFESNEYANMSEDDGANKKTADIPIVITQNDISTSSTQQSLLINNENEHSQALSLSLEKQTESTIKEISEKVDSSYDVITSCSILLTPLPAEILPDFDITDSGKQIIKQLREAKRARSYTDLSKSGQQRLIDISKKSSMDEDEGGMRNRCSTAPTNALERTRRWSSFSSGFDSKNSPTPGTPETMKKAIARVAALTLTPYKDLDDSRDIEHSL